jgi:hypothetical protein
MWYDGHSIYAYTHERAIMLQLLDSRGGLSRYVLTLLADLDLPALLALMAEAWQADYTDHVRPDFTEAFLRRLMAGTSWVGILVCTDAGQPVRFELALGRMLWGYHTRFPTNGVSGRAV